MTYYEMKLRGQAEPMHKFLILKFQAVFTVNSIEVVHSQHSMYANLRLTLWRMFTKSAAKYCQRRVTAFCGG